MQSQSERLLEFASSRRQRASGTRGGDAALNAESATRMDETFDAIAGDSATTTGRIPRPCVRSSMSCKCLGLLKSTQRQSFPRSRRMERARRFTSIRTFNWAHRSFGVDTAIIRWFTVHNSMSGMSRGCKFMGAAAASSVVGAMIRLERGARRSAAESTGI